MARLRFNFKTREWEVLVRRESPPRVHIRIDTTNPTWHPVDGRIYESRSAFKEVTKAAGCVECGDIKPEDIENHVMPIVRSNERYEAVIEDVLSNVVGDMTEAELVTAFEQSANNEITT